MATRDKKSPVDVIAAQNTAALFLPYRAMMASCAHACEHHALLRENLLAEIAEKYWRLRRRAEYLARHSLRARIAAFLLDAAADAGGNTFSLGMRRILPPISARTGAPSAVSFRGCAPRAGSTAAATVCGSSIPPRSQRAPRRRIGAEKNERNRKSERELSAALRRLTG